MATMLQPLNNNGLGAQQIMIRDGGLKLRLDQFDFLQGRSQNWVAALNFNTTLPKQLLPFKNPLKAFLDVGTFAEAWEKDASISRFLFVGGLQLSLFQKCHQHLCTACLQQRFQRKPESRSGAEYLFQKIYF